MNTVKHFLYIAFATFFLFACGNKQKTPEQESDYIEITKQQFSTESMELGEIKPTTFETIINCNGTIVPQPDGMAKVSAALNGIVKSINCHNGQSVNKNQLLIEIAGTEIIDLQKEFAETSANYKRIKNDYERIQMLYNEKVSSEKDFILAESEFKAYKAKYNALKLKIEYIGLSVSKIENGEFYSSYSIKSPMNGTITHLNTNIGSYIDSQTQLFEIINSSKFNIKLSVFTSDIANLKIGQIVRYKSLNSNEIHIATISSIGVAIDNETKSIECYAAIKDKTHIQPIANEFVETDIVTNVDLVNAIPTEAIIKTETADVILVLEKQENDKYFFKKMKIKIGKQYNGYSEILSDITNKKILTKGAYSISTE